MKKPNRSDSQAHWKFNCISLCAFLWILLVPRPLHAATIPELTQYFEKQLYLIQQATQEGAGQDELSEAPVQESAWFLRRFWLRIKTPISFMIPSIAKVEISPEFEYLYQREYPSGWTNYRPKL